MEAGSTHLLFLNRVEECGRRMKLSRETEGTPFLQRNGRVTPAEKNEMGADYTGEL